MAAYHWVHGQVICRLTAYGPQLSMLVSSVATELSLFVSFIVDSGCTIAQPHHHKKEGRMSSNTLY